MFQRKRADYVEGELELDEPDLTVSEAKAIYQEMKDYIFEKRYVKVSSQYIAQIKQKYGIIERENYNSSKAENVRQSKCPLEKERLIEEALRHFKMIYKAQKMYVDLVKSFAEKEKVMEDLKVNDAQRWICLMNHIRNRAMEIVNAEIIFS